MLAWFQTPPDLEGAMLCSGIGTQSVPRAELDDRARDSRLRFERLQRLFLPVGETARARIIPFSRPGGGLPRPSPDADLRASARSSAGSGPSRWTMQAIA
jgi:hypothetical protein